MTVIDALLKAEETIDNLVGPEERDCYSDTLMGLQRAMTAVNEMKDALQDVVDYANDPNMSMSELVLRCKLALKKYKKG